jgi:hypothetical protein
MNTKRHKSLTLVYGGTTPRSVSKEYVPTTVAAASWAEATGASAGTFSGRAWSAPPHPAIMAVAVHARTTCMICSNLKPSVFIIYLLRIQLVTPIGALGATCQIDKCQKDINPQHDLSRFLKGKESMTMWLNKGACADQ